MRNLFLRVGATPVVVRTVVDLNIDPGFPDFKSFQTVFLINVSSLERFYIIYKQVIISFECEISKKNSKLLIFYPWFNILPRCKSRIFLEKSLHDASPSYDVVYQLSILFPTKINIPN